MSPAERSTVTIADKNDMSIDLADMRRLYEETLKSFSAEVTSIGDPYGLLRIDTPEMPRYVTTLEAAVRHARSLNSSGAPELCDLGGYFGVMAGALGRLGYAPTVVDSYGTVLTTADHTDLRGWWDRNGVRVYDVDLQRADLTLPFPDQSFHLVTLLAVLEHFPHTPRLVLAEIRRILRRDGLLIVDTPNAGALATRVGFAMHGGGLWDSIERLYFSEIPFHGHSRCYNREELVKVLQWSGFEPEEINLFDLAGRRSYRSLKSWLLYRVIYELALKRFPGLRGYLWIAARPVARTSAADRGMSPGDGRVASE
jgi:SAM-dependent methyltransferase